MLEQVLVNKLFTHHPHSGPVVNYLVRAYGRLEEQRASGRVVDELKYLLLSYIGLVLTIPAMFPQSPEVTDLGPRIFVPLLTGIDANTMASITLLSELTNRFVDERDTLREIFESIFLGVVETIHREGLLGRHLAGIEAIQALLMMVPLQQILTTGDLWTPSCAARDIGSVTVMGGMLNVGIDPQHLAPLFELLPNRKTVYAANQVDSANYAMRTALGILHNRLHQLFLNFIKSAPDNKEAMLKWLAWLAQSNRDRLKMHVDSDMVSPDRLLANAFGVLLKFCAPFLVPNSPKMAMIDPLYYVRSDRIDVEEATKNHATAAEFTQFAIANRVDATNGPYQAGFVTECFYLTVQYFRLGMVRMINEYVELLRNLRDAKQALDYFESQPGHDVGMNAIAIRNAKSQIQRMKDCQLALEVYLLDARLMDDVFSFVSLMINWIFTLLLPTPQLVKMLPEFFVECIGEYLLFISRFQPEFWLGKSSSSGMVMKFMTILLDQAPLVKNPYIRAKFVDFMFGMTVPQFEHFFDSDSYVVDNLVPKMMRFYVEVESTGASSAFYDKFNIRYNISKIFKCIWTHPPHHSNFILCSKDAELFIRFTNLLLNDATYLLDESISKLMEIHERQVEQIDPDYSSRSARERQERENGLRTLERQCESYMQLSLSTLDLLEYLTVDIVKPFLRPELVDRLAAMLSFNIVQLVGPKCVNLKVKNPEKYHWEPRTVLKTVIGILLNMSCKETFLRAVARDTRSFSRETFINAVGILRRHGIRPECDIQRFERLISRVEELAAVESKISANIGEIPDEFLDPLMFTLMDDPVMLETSKMVVDRSTIVAHLLNDPTDPFNRMPLTIEQVKGQDDLRLKIQKFKKEHDL